jgi:hypothetical protein
VRIFIALAMPASDLRIVPDPPQAHMMHVYRPGSMESLLRAATRIADEERRRQLDLAAS